MRGRLDAYNEGLAVTEGCDVELLQIHQHHLKCRSYNIMLSTHNDAGGAVPEIGTVGPGEDVPLPGIEDEPVAMGAVGPVKDDMLVREYPGATAQNANR